MASLSQTTAQRRIRVGTWNVLSNWWYVFKYYTPTTDTQHRHWNHREQLSEAYLRTLDADIVCLQEINPEHVREDKEGGTSAILPGKSGDDLAFARRLGYDFVMEGDGNDFMRCCVVYRRSLFRQPAPQGKNNKKTMVTSRKYVSVRLEPMPGSRLEGSKPLVVVCAHLPAGDSAHSNGVQVLAQALKATKKIFMPGDALILGGDFNMLESDTHGAPPLHFLRHGNISTSYEWASGSGSGSVSGSVSASVSASAASQDEATGAATKVEQVNLKYEYSKKSHSFGSLQDAVEQLNQLRKTFVVPDLFAKFKRVENKEEFSLEFNNAVEKIFDQITKNVELGMTPDEIETWITCIHGEKEKRTMDGANQERMAKARMLAISTGDMDWWEKKRSVKHKHDVQQQYEAMLSVSGGNDDDDDGKDDGKGEEKNKCMRLKLEDFRLIMKQECNTNPWSVQYDFQAYGVDWEDTSARRPPYERAIDRIFYGAGLILDANKSQASLFEAQVAEEQSWFEACNFLPNEFHPSDHLGVTADFQVEMMSSAVVVDAMSTSSGDVPKSKKSKKLKKLKKTQELSENAVLLLEAMDVFGSVSDFDLYVESGAEVGSKSFEGKFSGLLWSKFLETEGNESVKMMEKRELKILKSKIQTRARVIIESSMERNPERKYM